MSSPTLLLVGLSRAISTSAYIADAVDTEILALTRPLGVSGLRSTSISQYCVVTSNDDVQRTSCLTLDLREHECLSSLRTHLFLRCRRSRPLGSHSTVHPVLRTARDPGPGPGA
ncbi:hypothetical protein B0H15DRAFT_957448 [Mycena belliarum]|uniref:Secreted protein n=1 Tax=Mycena belliarum TaxID=1033014 RepID=A0AAD6TPV8_9AGAR|nr:hypothetical protein B0H15DRAFT_957448 [Mycena belliae]